MKAKDYKRLSDQISRNFEGLDIGYVFHSIGIDRESIGGSNEKEFAQNLILYAERVNKVNQLLETLQTNLPDVNWSTTEDKVVTQVSQPDLGGLRTAIYESFSIKELQVVCFDLGIDFDELGSDTPNAKVIELIKYTTRRGRLQDLISYVKAARPNHIYFQQTKSINPIGNTKKERESQRDKLRADRKDINLVHSLRPSLQSKGWYDILIYLIPHMGEELSAVKSASFFLGKWWSNKIFEATIQDDFIGIATSAYGPTLCTCSVLFNDGTSTLLERYIDFEMAEAFTVAASKKPTSNRLKSRRISR